ncbi:Zn-dependent alcohol dehydrogenase [Microbacterium sp. No. 7]|uniref:Zn-dependent alcohol dehydrogenase n=1 Tax=Microbacterium sp. No. 7 TaxID=1714373 RepID=UPI0006D28BA0|nr:Zn-dependent alcohol dehydrogenase [Microbacterium sp. No. 7]ALJ19270.1 alcohol dehydrogenase [Microbacterium sp. No. 7]
MKAAVMFGVGQPLEIRDIELDDPQPREVIVKVKASGLCHSDLHTLKVDFGWPVPLVLGHEVAGIVEAVGDQVTAVKVGDHVVGNVISTCGVCDSCSRGEPTRCTNPGAIRRGPDERARYTLDGQAVTQIGDIGGFAEKILVHERNLVVVDKSIPFDRAALLGCGVVTGIGAVKNAAKVGFGDTVAVIGCGGVGLNVVQGAALSGARNVIALDLQPAKLELARKFGATDVINPAEEPDVVARVREIVGKGGVDFAFEVIGLPQTAQQAIDITDVGGTAYVLGKIPPGKTVGLESNDLLRGQKKLSGLFMGSTIASIDVPLYATMYQQGRLNLDDLVSETISLDEINEGYEKLEKGETARSVVVFD